MANEFDQSKVAYEDGPKEVNTERRLQDGDAQFGKADKMLQGNKDAKGKPYVQKDYPANPTLRGGEYR